MSKASTKGKGKGPSATEAQQPAKGGDLGPKRDQKSNATKPERTDNAKPTTGEGRGQATQRGRGGGVAGGAGRGGQQRPAGGRGGGGAATGAVYDHSSTYASKYPRLDLEKENKKLADLTSQIDAAYQQMDLVRERIDVIQGERKAIQDKDSESRDLRNEAHETKNKVLAEKDALRKALDQQNTARKRKLEELNKQKKDLPINKDIKDTKKLIAANLEQLEREERAAETKIKTAATTGQDRGASKELQGIAAKKRIVREWAKLAAEAEAPVDPALEARLKQVDEQLKKLNEEERTARNAVNVVKDALHAKGDELGAAKMERSAIAQTVDKLKKDRDAVYAAIRDKRKEHQTKIKELQKAEREKKAVLDKEKRIKAKKEQRERALQELTDAFKDELTLCDRLSTFLVNRQSKPKKGTAAVSGEQEEAKKEEAGEGEAVAEEEEEEEEEERKEEGEEDTEEQQDEAAPSATAATRRRKAFQFTNATHIDFELLSVQPPTSLDEIPAALESIARKKAFYERLAASKLELRKKVEAQYDAELAALESPTPKKAAPNKEENGKAAAPRTKKTKEAKEQATKEEESKEDSSKEEEKEEAEEVDAVAQEAEDGADE